MTRIPHPRSGTEVRQAFQALADRSDVITTGVSDYILVGQGIGVAPAWQVLSSAIDHGGLGGLAGDDHSQYHNNTRGDARYFTETEHLNTSAGAADAGKPIKLDANGHVDATMLNDADVDHDSITNTHDLTSDIDHGSISGLADDDHPQYAIGTITATNNNAGTIYKCYAVFADDDDDVDLTDALSETDSRMIGLVADTSIASAASGNIRTAGVLTATTEQWDTCGAEASGGLVAGTKYYLGTGAGTLSNSRPTQPAVYTESIGIALNTTDMLVYPQKINDVVEQITEDLTIYVSTTGNDVTGIGDSENPLATLAGALAFLGPKLISATATITIQIADGTYTETSATGVTHANGDRINIVGENVHSKTLSSIQSSSGSSGAWSIILNLNSVADIDVGDYLLIPYNLSGGTRWTTLCGCHEITNVDSGNTRITITSVHRHTSAPSGAVSGTVKVVKTILKYSGCTGLTFSSGVSLGKIDKVVLLGTGTNSGIYLPANCLCTMSSGNIGIANFHTGVLIYYASVLNMNSGIISGCTRNADVVTAILGASYAVMSGASSRGLNVLQGNVVCQAAVFSGNDYGIKASTASSVIFATSGYCTWNPTYGIHVQNSTFIEATTSTISNNGTNTSPAVNTLGNIISYIKN